MKALGSTEIAVTLKNGRPVLVFSGGGDSDEISLKLRELMRELPRGQQITEIIADTEGLRLALDLAKKEENFDYDAFFRAYARYWNWYYSNRETYLRTFSTDVHPAPMFRVNFTVQLTDEFYETYSSVTEGTPMYLPPEERELVW